MSLILVVPVRHGPHVMRAPRVIRGSMKRLTKDIDSLGDAATAAFSPQRTTNHVTPRLVLRLAVLADVDPRSAKKALEEGAAAVRGRAGERIAEAATAHGIVLGTASVDPSRSPGSAA